MTTHVPSLTSDAPSLLRSLLFAGATVAFLALSLGALYGASEPAAPGPVAASR